MYTCYALALPGLAYPHVLADICNRTANKSSICSVPCPSRHHPNDTGPCPDPMTVALRRHMQRVYEIVREFAEVFGYHEINNRIRGVYCDWTVSPSNFNQSLTWFEAVNGKGSAQRYLWAICPSAYFNYNATKTLPAKASVAEIVKGYLNASGTVPSHTNETRQVADSFGLRMAA